MVCQIGRDRENSPLPLDEEEDEEPESQAERFALTVGLGKSLYKREDVDLSAVQDASVERVPGDDVEAKDVQRGDEGGSGKATGVDSAGVCDCGGRLCSKHGIYFSLCLSKCVPVENVSLAKVARECVFVTKDPKEMLPNHFRFLC